MIPEFKDFLADAITEARWAPTVLERLFSAAPGAWVGVSLLCRGLDDATELYNQLVQRLDNEIVAAWLPHPHQPSAAFLVLFYQDDEMDSAVSIVTRTYLEKIIPSIIRAI